MIKRFVLGFRGQGGDDAGGLERRPRGWGVWKGQREKHLDKAPDTSENFLFMSNVS